MASARAQFPGMLATEIPYSSEIERMSVRRAPIPAFAPKSVAGQVYSALWAEIAGRVGWKMPAGAMANCGDARSSEVVPSPGEAPGILQPLGLAADIPPGVPAESA
jgi:hypothetical protein